MGAEQVAAILRQAGQESIRLVVARPIDPTVPNYMVSSAGWVSTNELSCRAEKYRSLSCFFPFFVASVSLGRPQVAVTSSFTVQ